MKKIKNINLEYFSIPKVEVVIYDKITAFKKKPTIGIFGSSSEFQTHRGFSPIAEIKEFSLSIGKELAKSQWNIITTGCSGIPYWIAKSAKDHGAFVVGFSPFKSQEEHQKDKGIIPAFPVDQNSIVYYTNLGFQFCDVLVSSLSDIGLVFGGGLGSLRESASLVEYEKPLICFNNKGGISQDIPRLFKEHFSSLKKLSLYTCQDLKDFIKVKNKLTKNIIKPNRQIQKILKQILS